MRKITCVDATDFPSEVDDYCTDNEISTHYQSDVVVVSDDGNVFAEWLKKEGHVFEDTKYGDYIAIIAT